MKHIMRIIISSHTFSSLFCLACLVVFLSGCGSSSLQEQEITIYYTPKSGEYVNNPYGYGTLKGVILPDESLEEAQQKGKTILTLQAWTNDSVISMAKIFNTTNDKYHIECELYSENDFVDKRNRLLAEIVSGSGPDITTYSAMPYVYDIMDKGCFVDLSPLMEKSEFRDDYFFPGYKAITYEDKIYGLAPSLFVYSRGIKKDVIGMDRTPSFEEFVDAILNYPKDAIFFSDAQKPIWILEYFLTCSESMHGMIDWNNGICDFTGELFSKILDIVVRYDAARNKGFEPIMKNINVTLGLPDDQNSLDSSEWVEVNYWFDDGNFPMYNINTETLLINSNTSSLEGAWAFVSFCMSIGGQSYSISNPSNKEVYGKICELEQSLANETGKDSYTTSSIEAYTSALERGKSKPYKIIPVWNIIKEEAQNYFDGVKSKEDTIFLIQRRVQLYLNEKK